VALFSITAVAEFGETEIEKPVTVRVTVVLCVRLPLTPVRVRVYAPAGVEVEVVTVSVDEPPPVIVVGLNAAVAPVGNPLALKVTTPVKPLTAVVVKVYVLLSPASTVRVLGVAATVKLGGTGFTMRIGSGLAAFIRLPLVP
jgi:hypothetical protein